MTKFLLPLLCLLAGGAVGYGLRSVSGSAEKNPVTTDAVPVGSTKGAHPTAGKSTGGSASDKAAVGTGRAASTASAGLSLGDRMKELLADYDMKSAQKAAARLSVGDLQAALELVGGMPKSSDRDSLRAQLYRAWAAQDPNAAWKAALADTLEKDRTSSLSAGAAELAKASPIAAINLALSLGMGARRSTVMSAVFSEWSKTAVVAAIAYSNSHPELPVESFSFSRGLSLLAEKDPNQAANVAITLKDSMGRASALSSLMTIWTDRDPAAALEWAQALSNPTMSKDAIAAAIGAWAKNDPAAALAHAQSIPDADTRINSLKKGWTDWFRKDPPAATSYLASAGDDKLLQSLGYTIGYLSENSTPKERAELLAQVPEGKAKQDMVRSMTDLQIRKGQFNQALEMLNAMPDSVDRDRNVNKLGEEWAAADPAATAAWLKLQPDSSDRDLAVAGYARTLARSDPVAAVEWAKTIPDETLRKGAMKNVAIRWFGTDSAKAEAWMAGVPEFSESDKKIIRDMGSRHFDLVGFPITVGNRR